MNFDFSDRRRAERFAELLDETTTTRDRRHQQRQHSRVQTDEELAELVAIGHSLSAARPGIRVDSEFRVGLRAMLVATAERDGIGRTATAVDAEPAAGHVASIRSGGPARVGRRIRARSAIVIGVATGAMAVSGISAASENASPGDALYGVKRSTERAQLAMAGSDVTRGQLSLDFARNRLAEAVAMSGGPGFAGVLNDMDADTRKGVKLLTTSSVARADAKPLTTIDDFVGRQRRSFAAVLDQLRPGDRERAMNSLSLLEAVQRRTADLRAGLACTPVTQIGADSLGPRLRDCTSNADNSSSVGRGPIRGGKPTSKSGGTDGSAPDRTDPTADPEATAGTSVPGLGSIGPDLAPIGGTPSQSVPPADGDAEEDEGVLGGLLGGIFGGS